MKKKLLTLLLAVVMVFGVFGLTACGGGTNPDESYNYYSSKYEVEGEVKIDAVTFQGVYKMFTTAGNFLLYVDSEDTGAAARFQAINKLANEWNVTIYHFNPDLSGGFASVTNANIIKELAANVNAGGIATMQNTLSAISQVDATEIKDHSLLAVKGAESSASASGVAYKGKIAKAADYTKGAEAIAAAATRKPSYGATTDTKKDVPAVPEAYDTTSIKTMNLFADGRLHMYNEDGTDALTAEKTDVYVTVANYGMFAHLLDNNQGYFAVFFGGTWCPNTQAIAMLTNDLAKDYGISKIYFFDPRLDDGTKIDTVSSSKDESGKTVYSVVENGAYLASSLNTRNNDVDAMWTNLFKDKDGNAILPYAQYISAAKALLADITVENGDFKPEAKYDAQEIVDDAIVAKAATLDAKYLAAAKADYTEAEWEKLIKGSDGKNDADKQALIQANLVIEAYNADEANEETIIDVNAVSYDALAAAVAAEAEFEYADLAAAKAAIEAKAQADYKNVNYNFANLYGTFLKQYLPSYTSEWNIGVEFSIGGEKFTKMCVPNMMMFNGEGEGKAALVGLAEAEYSYGNTSVEGSAENVAWTNAIKAIFDANPYALYNPIIEAPAADAGTTGGSTSGSTSGGAASGGAAADSGC